MIITKVYNVWRCTLCQYAKQYTPGNEKPPIYCPACGHGTRVPEAFKEKLKESTP